MEDFVVKTGNWKKKILPVLAIAFLVTLYFLYQGGYIAGRPTNKVETVKLDQIDGRYVKETNFNVPKLPLPGGEELAGKPFITINIYDWHANTAIPYANGGPITVENSLIAKEGLFVKIVHQDDTPTSIKEFRARVLDFKESDGKRGGNLAFTIMGNASVPLIEPLQKDLREIDPSYGVVAIDLNGKSDGEDQVVGPIELLTNPEAMRGKVIVGVYDDGDIQLAAMLADKVDIPMNFDYHTYNPNALNIENTATFMTAGKIFVNTRELEPRPVVDDEGHRTGKTTKDLGIVLKPDMFASWTPADRNLLRDIGQMDPERLKGLATITSTGVGEQRKVMPCVLLVFNKWADQNVDKLGKLLYAFHVSSMQIDKYPDALQKAMVLNTGIMGIWDDGADEATAAQQRLDAFKGYNASQNKKLHIGGSAVFSFKDAMNMVGMTDNGDDLANSTFASVYRSFGNLTIKKYPEKNLKSYTPFEKFFDPRPLRIAYERAKREGIGSGELMAKRDYTNAGSGQAIGSTNFKITFRMGSSELQPSAYKTLQEIQDSYAGTDYGITIVGHTDRTGSNEVNTPLSLERANTVKDYLVTKNRKDFGGDRITTEGRGSSEPAKGVDPNYTGESALCRRVEIVIYR